MSTGTRTDATRPGQRGSHAGAPAVTGYRPRTRRRLVWGSLGAVCVAAVAAVLVLGPDTDAPVERIEAGVAQEPERRVQTPLPAAAKRVAMRFIQTAVARENLDEAWELVGPNLRGGLSKERWTTGANPVVPFPIDKLEVAPYKVDEAYERSALIEIALLPRKGSGVRAQIFFLELKKLGTGGSERWVVDNWVPRASVPTPR